MLGKELVSEDACLHANPRPASAVLALGTIHLALCLKEGLSLTSSLPDGLASQQSLAVSLSLLLQYWELHIMTPYLFFHIGSGVGAGA